MLLISAPEPKPMTAPMTRFDSVKRIASAAPSRSDTAARPPHRPAA